MEEDKRSIVYAMVKVEKFFSKWCMCVVTGKRV